MVIKGSAVNKASLFIVRVVYVDRSLRWLQRLIAKLHSGMLIFRPFEINSRIKFDE